MPVTNLILLQKILYNKTDNSMSETLNIKRLFPAAVKSYCCQVQDHTDDLHTEEAIIISKAIDKRRYEFSAGRLCARRALKQIGIDNCTLTQGEKGEPIWPEQITGTISHSKKWAAAAVSTTNDIMAIGFDIETINRINSGILKRIITEQEKEQLEKKDKQKAQEYSALIFSAKEAIYKALSSKYNGNLRFKDVCILCKNNSPEFEIELNNGLKSFLKDMPLPLCKFMIHGNDIFTAITFPRK
jgi:phosphopantetheine--protein transferase-like protein